VGIVPRNIDLSGDEGDELGTPEALAPSLLELWVDRPKDQKGLGQTPHRSRL
jgi:hypothetical protein